MSSTSDVTGRFSGALVFISSIADKEEIRKNILDPLMFGSLLLGDDVDIDFTKIDNVARNLVLLTDSRKVTMLHEPSTVCFGVSHPVLWTVRKRRCPWRAGQTGVPFHDEPATEAIVARPERRIQ